MSYLFRFKNCTALLSAEASLLQVLRRDLSHSELRGREAQLQDLHSEHGEKTEIRATCSCPCS